MRLLSSTGCVCLLAASHALALGASAAEPVEIRIRLYNSAGVSRRELRQATEEASHIFRKANIGVVWIHCDPDAGNLPAGHQCRETGDSLAVGLVKQPPDFMGRNGLGFALVSISYVKHAGVLYPRVAELARRYPMQVQTHQVLAYAIAHEVAHLIFGSTAHAPFGILRETFRPAELEAISQRRLTFSAEESAEMQRRLAK